MCSHISLRIESILSRVLYRETHPVIFFYICVHSQSNNMGRDYRVYSKTAKTPRRPFEKERIDAELKLVGEYGLKNKREVWRVQLTLGKIRSVARNLLTLDEKNPKRIFEGQALIRRLNRMGLLNEGENKLDYVLGLTIDKFLDRRLQTRVLASGNAKSIHHARVLIKQRHIR